MVRRPADAFPRRGEDAPFGVDGDIPYFLDPELLPRPGFAVVLGDVDRADHGHVFPLVVVGAEDYSPLGIDGDIVHSLPARIPRVRPLQIRAFRLDRDVVHAPAEEKTGDERREPPYFDASRYLNSPIRR